MIVSRTGLAALVAATFLISGASPLAPLPAAAQGTAAAVLDGVVRAPSSAVQAGARVTIAGASVSRTLVTDASGAFSASGLPPDTYTIVVNKGGFEESRIEGVTITPAAPAHLIVTLVAAGLETIGSTRTDVARAINTTPAAIATVSGDTFVQQGQTQVLNVLDQIPGVEVQRFSSGAPGANSAVALRGASTFETQTLIDGHPVSAGTNGDYNTTFLNSLLLGGVEVVKGPVGFPNTVENAIGGSVNFRTPSITSKPSGLFLAGYDSFNGDYFAARYSQTIGKVGFLVGYARSSTPGYFDSATLPIVEQFAGPTNPVSPIPLGTVTGSIAAHQAFDSRAQVAKIAYNFTPSTSLAIGVFASQAFNDESGTLDNYDPVTVAQCISSCSSYTAPQFQNLIGRTINGYYGYGHDLESNVEPIYSAELRSAAGPGTLLARYYAGSILRTINQTADAAGVTACGDPSCSPSANGYSINQPFLQNEHDVLHGVDATYTLPVGNATVALGFDRHSDLTTFCAGDPQPNPPDTPYNCLLSNGNVPGTLISSNSVSLRAEAPLTPKLELSVGGYQSNTTFAGSRFDPRAGLVFRPNPSAAVRVSYGSAYVAPFAGNVVNEAYVNPGFGNNPSTLVQTTAEKPETSSSFDLGTDIALDRYTKLTFDAYNTRLFNRFASQTIAQSGTFDGQTYGQVQQNFNESNAREAGLELSVARRPRVGFGFTVSGELLRAYAYNVDTTTNGNAAGPYSYLVDGAQLGGYPFSKERAEINYTSPSGLFASFGATAYGQWNAFGEPGFAVFDGSVTVPFVYGAALRLGGTNLFNHDNYRTFTEYDYGYATNQGSGSYYPRSLFFYQPRTIYLQLERRIGRS